MGQLGKRVRVACGLGILTVLAGGAFIACGGDDTIVLPGGTDGGGDATTDSGSRDSGVSDTGTGMDATMHDSGTDSGPPADSGMDSSTDGGGMDVFVPDASAAVAFRNQLANAFCTNFQGCCEGTGFDLNLCITGVSPEIFQGSTSGIGRLDVQARDRVAFDPDAGARCIADMASRGCTDLTSAQQLAASSDCLAALHGTLPLGSPCLASIECQTDGWCAPLADGGVMDAGEGGIPTTGVCSPFLDAGADCTANQAVGDSCSYLGGQVPPAYCNPDDYTNQNTPYHCISGLSAIGQPCFTNASCASDVCDFNANADTPLCAASTDTTTSCVVYHDAGT